MKHMRYTNIRNYTWCCILITYSDAIKIQRQQDINDVS